MRASQGGPRGVAVQMHAYIGSPPTKPDNSVLRVKDGKQINIVDGGTGESLALTADHVYEKVTEREVMERSLDSLAAACVEGVNVSVLAIGSAKAQKSRVLFAPMPELGIATAVFQSLLDRLHHKVTAVSNNSSGAAVAAIGSRKNLSHSSATFSLQISFAEFYEETITDLLASSNSSSNGNGSSGSPVVIVEDPGLGKTIKNWTQSPPLTSVASFRQLLDAGLHARRSSNGLYGNATEFSSAVLRISVGQVFEFHDAPPQELHSVLDFVDLPATDRLARLGASVRLSEGPLLNKSLFALQEVVESLSQANEVSIPYQASQLTTLLQDALGGNSLTFVLMCLSPGDLAGSTATFQLGGLLPRVQTFPVVNNDIVRGLRCRQHMHSRQMFGDQHAKQQYREGKQELAVYERSLHDLEGKLAQSGLERRVLREDKDILTAQLNELRSKYRELFDNELSLRTELLACEQEKLALSKAFLAFQLERDTQVQQLDSDKFEAETRLLKAEQLVVEIQQDDATKATQIQDLCAKMNELVADKTRLGGELAMLQKATKAAEEARGADAKKNQQLSLELIIAVNQKQKLQNEMEALTMQLRQHQAQIDAQTAECKQLRSENAVLRDQATAFEVKLESIRKDVVRREMELERAELAVKKEQLETQQAGRNADHQHEHSVKRLNEEIEAQRAAFAQDKRLLELQLERTQHDVARENREKHHATAALTAKNEENEELLLALERTRHDLQAQLEAFRLKLTLLHQPASSEDRLSEAGAGVRALRELLATYQQREQDLRDELDSARSLNLRLARRLRDPAQDTTEPQPNDDSETDRISPIQFKNESEDMEQMRKRLAAAEQRTTMDMKQLSDQAVIIAELESQKADQIQRREKQHQQVASVQSNDNGVHAIAEMHTALARQLEEVRRLTLQQQNQQSERVANNASPSSKDKNTTELSANSNELESLREAKAQLEARLSSNKAHWISLLEQVERRCAELLTKNVMLTEDNESLRQHLKKAHRAQLSKPSRK